MQKLPPLTAHALDLSERFSGVQEMADTFAMGSVGLEAREKEALCASIISALFRYPDYIFSVDKHLGYPDRCARLLYAALYAQWSVMPRPDALAYVNGLIEESLSRTSMTGNTIFLKARSRQNICAPRNRSDRI